MAKITKEEIFTIFYGKETWDNYHKFKELEDNIESSNELYQYFLEITKMLEDEKDFIRVRAFRIICKLSKWDKDNQINNILDLMLKNLDDEKPTNVRQCLASLKTLLIFKPELKTKIQTKVHKINYLKYKDSMSPLIKKDMDDILNN